MFSLNLQSSDRQIVLANAHYYQNGTSPRYLDRTLQYHDLIYLVEGSWTFTEEEQDYHLEKDDVLLLSAGHHHYTRMPCSPGTRTFCIHVSNEPGDCVLSPESFVVSKHIHVKNNTSVRKYFEKITATFWSENPYKKQKMASLFQLMMLELHDICQTEERPLSNLMSSVRYFITQNAHKRLTLNDVANQFSVSVKTIENLCQTHAGMSFAKYQMQLKLEMVASLLEVEPDMRLLEVAELFGFYDEFHLSHAFKTKYGISPKQYKEKER